MEEIEASSRQGAPLQDKKSLARCASAALGWCTVLSHFAWGVLTVPTLSHSCRAVLRSVVTVVLLFEHWYLTGRSAHLNWPSHSQNTVFFWRISVQTRGDCELGGQIMTKCQIFCPSDPRKKPDCPGWSSTEDSVPYANCGNCLSQTVRCCRDSLHSRLAAVEPQITH